MFCRRKHRPRRRPRPRIPGNHAHTHEYHWPGIAARHAPDASKRVYVRTKCPLGGDCRAFYCSGPGKIAPPGDPRGARRQETPCICIKIGGADRGPGGPPRGTLDFHRHGHAFLAPRAPECGPQQRRKGDPAYNARKMHHLDGDWSSRPGFKALPVHLGDPFQITRNGRYLPWAVLVKCAFRPCGTPRRPSRTVKTHRIMYIPKTALWPR